MTNLIAFILTLSFSFLFGVDTPKEIDSQSQITTEIQFDADTFQQNQLIKKGLQESYKQARRAKGIPKPDGKPVHISRKKGSGPSGKHFQKLESIKADLNPKNFFGDFNSRSAHKKEPAKVDYLTRRDEMKQKRAFALKKQNSMIPHGNDMSSYPTGYRTHQTENNGRPTIQNIRNRETISFFDYHDVHAYVSNWLTTNATFVVETEAGPEAGEDALQWVEGGETGADRSKVGWSFYPHIDLSSVWESVGVSDHWFRIEIKTDYSGDLKVYFSDGPGKYQLLTVTVQGTGLWETYEFPLSDTSPTTGANATDFNSGDISSLSIQDFNHQEGRTFYIGVIEIYSPADDENGVIEGMVWDNNGNSLSGASVTAYNANENISVMTNETGYYNMSVTDSSTYRVYASSTDFWDADIYPVTVAAGDIVILDFTLMPEADYAWIIGGVQDDMGNLVSEAVVTITDIDGVDVFSQPSDWSGTFYAVVAPGTYNIHADGELLSGDITLEAEAGITYYPVVELNDDLDFTIKLNGEQTATVEAGESVTLTIEFDMETGVEPYAGMLAIFYDANFNDELEPEEDLNLFEEDGEGPAVLLVDNMEPDENPDVGIIELTLDAQEDDGLGFLTLFQNSSWHFTSYDPENDEFGGSTATLDVTGFESGYSISGETNPPTPNMMVFAIVADSAGMDTLPHITLTQEDGSYHVDVADTGFYLIAMDDGLEIYGNLYASPSFQFVEVLGDESRINFEIVEYNTVVWGQVTNDVGDGIYDAEVWFSYHDDYEDVHIENDAWTDEDGNYEIWLQGGYDYDVNVWADGYMDHNDNVYVEGDFEYNVMLEQWGDMGVIEGYVWDPDSNGIMYAEVQAWNYDHWYITYTDENGDFFMEVPAGYYEMDASAEGFMSQWNDVEVYPGEYSWVEFWLDWEDDYAIVSGLVTDMEGNPIPFALVNASYLYDEWESEGSFTDSSGYYELYLQEGDYRISAGAEGFWVSAYDSVHVGFDDNYWLPFVLEHVESFDGAWQGNINLVGNYDPGMIFLGIMSQDYQVLRILYEPGYQEVDLVNGSYHLFAGADGYQEVFMPNAINIENNVVNFDINLIEYGLVLPPHINWAGDVPNDQGRQMRLVWGPGMPGEWGYFEFYSIWRQVNEAPMDLWDFIEVVPWHGMEAYSAVVPTLGDSTDMGIYWSTFRVTGHTENPNEFYDSAPVTGYSIDNLHPGAPGGVQAFTVGDGILLTWDSSMDEDFGYHRIYRHDTDSGDPAIEFTTVDTFYVDDVAEGNYEYWITAVDLNGNESDPSIIVTVTLAIDNGLAVPMEFALQQNYPNPFNPSTQIQYSLPTDANVSITIYDLMGRQIRTLINEQVSAGYHSTLWNATNDLGSPVSAGVYIYTISASEFRDVKKMILLK